MSELIVETETVAVLEVTTDTTVLIPVESVVVVEVETGPPGPPGTPGSVAAAFIYDQDVPSATWVIPQPAYIPHRPHVTVYTLAGEQVDTDVWCDLDAHIVTLTFPSPTAGQAVLS